VKSHPDDPTTLRLEVGQVANGGGCVARDDGHVVFVRHALPGELVRAEVTEAGRGFLRADAVEILRASPERVTPPCPFSGPGACGGCDFQHVSPAGQLQLKAAVVAEQLTRIAGRPDIPVTVEPLPGGSLGWRTRVQYAADASGRLGLRRHRSHDVVPIDRCRIAHPDIQAFDLTAERWPDGAIVEVVRPSVGEPVVLRWPVRGGADRGVRGVRVGRWHGRPDPGRHPESGAATVTERAAGREFTIAADGFWQVHPAAAETLAAEVVDLLEPRPGERAWDLYGGAGLFAAALIGPLGPGGRVSVVESDPRGATAARRSLADLPGVKVVRADVAVALANPRWRSVDIVVADPPRAGLGAEVVRQIAARGPRAVGYVSCDPATFARDVQTFATVGYRLETVRAFDAFPMTHHVEVIGRLTPVR
jgi:tRNA/tmRNA/rRNA uracil-C5-methylase (TrmA/RlmC/RlmD family)